MARNVWKHLLLLVSPKSTEEKQEELVDLHSLWRKAKARDVSLVILGKEPTQIYRKIGVLSQAANTLNIQKLQVFYLQRENARSEELQILQKQQI